MLRFLLASLLAAAAAPAPAADTVTVAADNYCPFNCEPGPTPGYGIEIMQKAFAAKGIAVEYKIMKWDDAVAAVRAGKLGAAIGALKSDAPDLVYPEQEFGVVREVLVVRKGDPWRYAGASSLAGRKVGIVEGYTYWDTLEAWMKANPGQVVRASSEEPLQENVKGLLTKKIDVVVEDGSVFAFKAAKLKLTDVVEKAGVSDRAQQPIYVAFSPANPKAKEWARIYSEGVDTLRKSGELATILKRYGLTDWK